MELPTSWAEEIVFISFESLKMLSISFSGVKVNYAPGHVPGLIEMYTKSQLFWSLLLTLDCPP